MIYFGIVLQIEDATNDSICSLHCAILAVLQNNAILLHFSMTIHAF